MILIARFALASAGFARTIPSMTGGRILVGQCGAGMPCECVRADGLEEPDVSGYLQRPCLSSINSHASLPIRGAFSLVFSSLEYEQKPDLNRLP